VATNNARDVFWSLITWDIFYFCMIVILRQCLWCYCCHHEKSLLWMFSRLTRGVYGMTTAKPTN